MGSLIPRLQRFRKDQKLACIPAVDEMGSHADFHSFRLTYRMLLHNSGALPRVAQELMRHSDDRLTNSVYTTRLPLAHAVSQLPWQGGKVILKVITNKGASGHNQGKEHVGEKKASAINHLPQGTQTGGGKQGGRGVLSHNCHISIALFPAPAISFMMALWKKLFGKDEKFYDLLEGSAEETKLCTHRLGKFLAQAGAPGPQSLEELVLSKRKIKQITQQITEELCRTFVTPLEREDIEALSNSLYKIPKTVVKIGERLLLSPPHLLQDKTLALQVHLLEQAADVVAEMVGQLRSGGRLDTIRDLNAKLQYYEGEADKHVIEILGQLFNGKMDAREIVFLKDLHELLERAIDRCRDAGNTVFQVVLKNS